MDSSKQFAGQNAQLSISQSSVASIISMLRGGIYSNPLESCLREVISNAWDANQSNITGIPVEVYVNGTEISIVDHGPGMSHEFMMNSYTGLAVSTKNKDEFSKGTDIGGFGIGRLTPLNVASKFTISTVNGGSKGIYVLSEETGLTCISYERTVETEGTTVSFDLASFMRSNLEFPYKGEEENLEQIKYLIADRVETTIKALCKFSITPIYFYDLNSSPDVNKLGGDIPVEDGYSMIEDVNRTYIRYGWITYEVSLSEIGIFDKYKPSKYDLLVPHVEPGTIDIVSSRESVAYTSKTKASLKEAFNYAYQDRLRIIEEESRQIHTFNKLLAFIRREDVVSRGGSWKGLSEAKIKQFFNSNLEMKKYFIQKYAYAPDRLKSYDFYKTYGMYASLTYLYDCGEDPKWFKARIKKYLYDTNLTEVVVLSDPKGSFDKDLLQILDLLPKVVNLEKPKPPKKTKASTPVDTLKHVEFFPRRLEDKVIYEDVDYLYIISEKGEPKYNEYAWTTLRVIQQMLGDERPIVILPRTKKRFEKLNNWSNADTLFSDLLEKYESDYIKLRQHTIDISYDYDYYFYIRFGSWVNTLPKDVLKYVSAQFFSKAIERHLGAYYPNTTQPIKYSAKEKYPELDTLLGCISGHPSMVQYLESYNSTH